MSLEDIRNRIRKAEENAGRASGSVTLIAVSKQQPDERVAAVLEAGHRCFGENRVQEAAGKWPDFRERFQDIDLHLIGPLQTNKARQAFDLFQSIHSVDRPKLAKTIARLAQEEGIARSCSYRSIPAKRIRRPGCCPLMRTISSMIARGWTCRCEG